MQRPPNGFQHSIGMQKYLVVPEPQHDETLLRQPGITEGVRRRFGMLAAVRLHDHARTEMHEVDDIRPDRLLAAELLPMESMSP